MFQQCQLRFFWRDSQHYTAISELLVVIIYLGVDPEEPISNWFKGLIHSQVSSCRAFVEILLNCWTRARRNQKLFPLYWTVIVFQHSVQHSVIDGDRIPLCSIRFQPRFFNCNLVPFRSSPRFIHSLHHKSEFVWCFLGSFIRCQSSPTTPAPGLHQNSALVFVLFFYI